VAYFTLLSQSLPEGNEETREESQLSELVSLPTFEIRISE